MTARLLIAFLLITSCVYPTTFDAIASGNWNNAATWTPPGPPLAGDTAYIGTTLPGAAIATVNLTANESIQDLFLGDGASTVGTISLGGNSLTVNGSLTLGLNGGIGAVTEGAGSLTVGNAINVESSNTFTYGASDTSADLNVYSASNVTTAATGNVTGQADVYSGSTLNLGANMNLSGSLDLENTGSVLNMNHYSLSASSIYFGWSAGQAVTISNRGMLSTSNLYIGNMSFNVNSGDSIGSLSVTNGTTTLSTAITGNFSLEGGSTGTLGADLNLGSNYLDVQDGSTLNMGGHNASVGAFYIGLYGSEPDFITDPGTFNANDLYLGNGSSVAFLGGDVINNLLSLSDGSTLTINQSNGQGLTLNFASASDLMIDPSSIDLVFSVNSAFNYDLAWKDPSMGGNWVTTLNTLIANNDLKITAPNGFEVVDSNGYTYIEGVPQTVSSTPEPAPFLMMAPAVLGLAAFLHRRRARENRSTGFRPLLGSPVRILFS